MTSGRARVERREVATAPSTRRPQRDFWIRYNRSGIVEDIRFEAPPQSQSFPR
jgi:hypothetical protein